MLGPAADRSGRTEDRNQEVVLWSGGYSPKALLMHGAAAVALSIVIVAVAVLVPMPGVTWLVAALALVLLWGALAWLAIYRRLNVSYELTNQRFVHQRGIVRRVTDRIEVIDIDDVSFQQGLADRLVGTGCVKITSSDRTHPELLLQGIDRVRTVAELLDDARRRERVKRGLHIESI